MAEQQTDAFSKMKTIFVSNLDKKTTENELYKLADNVVKGQTISVFIRREEHYETAIAYINMNEHDAAKQVIAALNGTTIKSLPVRMSWALTNPAKLHQHEANIFVKGIKKEIDQHKLQEIFGAFGEILSCRLSVNEKGESNGFGYVNFVEVEGSEKALQAIEQLKEKIGGENFVVEKYSKPPKSDNTNLYVGNIQDTITKEDFIKYFETFGPIKTYNGNKIVAFFPVAATGKNKGFVNFENAQDAEKALSSPKTNVLGEGELTIAYYKTKSERKRELKQKESEIKRIIATEYKDFNLYVQTNKDIITMEEINKEMAECGEVYSVKIRYTREKKPDGVFYICMKNKEDKEKVVQKCKEIGWISHNFKPREQQHKFNPYAMFGNMPMQMGNPMGNPMNAPMNYATAPFMFQILNMIQSMSQTMHMGGQFPYVNQQNQRRLPRRDVDGSQKKPRKDKQSNKRDNGNNGKTVVRAPEVVEKPKEEPKKEVITDEMKNDLGDNLYDYIVEAHKFDEEMTGRITGVLLESLEYHDLKNKLLNSKEELDAIINEIKVNLDNMQDE